MPGHTVLQLPAPALEGWVRERPRHYDEAFVSADPDFGHAHITALAPFAPSPTAEQLATIAGIAAATAPITVRLSEIGEFPDGIIHLRPEPEGPLRALTEALVVAFPEHPPYEGRFGPSPVPHLTLDAASDGVDVGSTRALLAGLVPVPCMLTELQLAWWESGRCHVMQRWPLRTAG
ncbi:2'-5' RNA ligase family protein [Janibacter limosus]|uniref:2'-5' RNA ligase family protein n=1 Tax=Janibacter limosus TaxID=53458 RepID=A0A4P6MZZ2_9MICO|nr:2'-5' RNA ligase family protein [Janibacter limosus]QBF47393.1 2'-5' RNA ligase family protein [Janibacter limosus]